MLTSLMDPLDTEESFNTEHYDPQSRDGAPAIDKKRRRALYRRDKIQRLAGFAAEQWAEQQPTWPQALVDPWGGDVMQPLPRAPRLGVATGLDSSLPPPHKEESFRPGFFRSIGRLFRWLQGGIMFGGGILWDKIRRRDSERRRAERLRHTFESLGTTFIKFGQQLSMRLDILPYPYTRELEKMLDKVPPMPTATAVEIIERAAKKPINELFAAFDPEPIGSASVSCVYRAVLETGEDVAVKVRRPGIGNELAADMRALGWILKVMELTFLKPGFTENFLFELRMMLMEELDFVREGRFTELFRRRMRKTSRMSFASAPKVYHELSNREVLVTEYLTGIWLTEVVTALETDDKPALQKLEDMRIDPVIIARRIQLIARFNNFENIFFHADLHPANILVKPGNRLVLIDFGSCGSFNRRELNAWRWWFDSQSVNDVGGMALAALAILEPLPPIDKDNFKLRLEQMFYSDLYAIKSRHSHWSERISARLWLGFLKLARQFGIPMRLNTLRMIRASMLADTIAARLDHGQNPYAEYRGYDRQAGRRARKRTFKRLRRFLGPGKWNRIEQSIDAGIKLYYRIQRVLDSPGAIRLVPMIGKAAQVILTLMRATMAVIGAAVTATAAIILYRKFFGAGETWLNFLAVGQDVVFSMWFKLFVVLPVIIAFRHVMIRLRDREYRNGDRN